MEALMHFSHRPISVAKNTAGYGRAHAAYILRDSAAVEILGTVVTAAEWGLEMELRSVAKRRDGRLCDRMSIAIPLAIPPEARGAFVKDFLATLVGGEAQLDAMAWTAAIHARGDDAANPHVHLMLRDQDLATGARVWKATDNASTIRARKVLETVLNRHLAMRDPTQFVDARSFRDRGLDRVPTRHVGPAANLNTSAIAWNTMARTLNTELDAARRGFDEANTRLSELREIEALPEPARAAVNVPQRVTALPPTVTPIAQPPPLEPPVPQPAPPRVATPPPLAVTSTVRDVVSSLVAVGESGDRRIDPALEAPWSDAIQRYDKTRANSRASGHGDIGTIPIRELLRDPPRRVAAVADPKIDVNNRLKRLIEFVRVVTIEARRYARERFESLSRSTRKPPPPTPPPLSR